MSYDFKKNIQKMIKTVYTLFFSVVYNLSKFSGYFYQISNFLVFLTLDDFS